jgi:hypothetical protein
MLRAGLLISMFVVLLWVSAMSEAVRDLLMFAGIFAVCITVDRWGRRER